jgi:hypothetical protein
MLNMDFVLAIAEDQVPSSKEPDPYISAEANRRGVNSEAIVCLETVLLAR